MPAPSDAPFVTEPLAAGAVCAVLQGRLDTAAVETLEAPLKAALAQAGGDALLDLQHVSFLSSMGVRLVISLAKAQKARGRRLALCTPQPAVRTTLDIVALDQIIPVAATRADALSRLAAG